MNSRRRFINVSYTMSYETYNEGFIMPEFHFHNDYEIYILESGRRIVNVGDDEFVTEAGDVVLFASEMPHKSRGEGGFAGICVHFSEIYLKRYFTAAAIDRFKAIFEAKLIHVGTEELMNIRQMTDEFVVNDEDNFLKLAKLFELLTEALKSGQEKAEPVSKPEARSKNKAAEVLSYVDEHYAYIKSAAEVARLFNISESYLFRIFKKEYNMTFKSYINRLRIKNICNRLKYSERAIKSVAEEYGFESYEHFCRVFKKEMGCTPMEYKKRIYQDNC